MTLLNKQMSKERFVLGVITPSEDETSLYVRFQEAFKRFLNDKSVVFDTIDYIAVDSGETIFVNEKRVKGCLVLMEYPLGCGISKKDTQHQIKVNRWLATYDTGAPWPQYRVTAGKLTTQNGFWRPSDWDEFKKANQDEEFRKKNGILARWKEKRRYLDTKYPSRYENCSFNFKMTLGEFLLLGYKTAELYAKFCGQLPHRSFTNGERAGYDCSHLCHNNFCYCKEHITADPFFVNREARKGCVGPENCNCVHLDKRYPCAKCIQAGPEYEAWNSPANA